MSKKRYHTVGAMFDDRLAALRNAHERMKREHGRIVEMYRQEIYDWCGHDLACEIVAGKVGVHQRIVRNIVAAAGNLF